jgi:hypothetical protein
MQPDQVLIACPKCRAWPMSFNNSPKLVHARGVAKYRCAHCGLIEWMNPEPKSFAASPERVNARANVNHIVSH